MGRGVLAGLLVTLCLTVTSFAYSAAVLRELVLEHDTIADAATDLVASKPVHDAFVDELVRAFEVDVFVMQHAQASDVFGFDTRAASVHVADVVVESPEFRDAVRQSLVELHQHIFEDRTGSIVVDATAVTEVARAAAIAEEPALAEVFPPTSELRVTIPIESTPQLGWMREAVDTGLTWAFIAAVGLAGAAFVIHHRRQRVLMSLGIGLLTIAFGHLLFSWALPELLDARYTESDDIPVAKPLGHAIADHIQGPAVLLAAIGVVLVVASLVWRAMGFGGRWGGGDWGGGPGRGRYDDAEPSPPNWAPPAVDQWGRPV